MMKALFVILLIAPALAAHDVAIGDREALREHLLQEWTRERGGAKVAALAPAGQVAAAAVASSAEAPVTAKPFLPFTRLDLRAEGGFLYVGSDGMPDHGMMTGITAWQQQVPLPQSYFNDNAWRIPLNPVPAKQPVLIKGRFLRGAIALAVNGIPIFNPQNNRGEISQEIGELDQWGGHCGRADDYHYHIAPLHLQARAGKGMPIAYALDGYPIYGLAEPDGSAVGSLDECHGHETPGAGYHYHASNQYPYVIGGFHGEVVEQDGQVDPQPRAQPVRPSLQALRGAKITGFGTTGKNSYKLGYEVKGDKRSVSYSIQADGTYPFHFDNGREGQVDEVYFRRGGGGGREEGRRPPPQEAARPRGEGRQEPKFVPRADQPRSSDGKFLLTSPVMEDMTEMPAEYTGDGAGVTLPLAWKAPPQGTAGYALLMDHAPPDGETKWYWTLWDIPSKLDSLPKDVRGIGTVGTGFKGRVGYEPPHSRGPGEKVYVITLYALSAPLQVKQPPGEVNREVLLAAMKGKVLASSSLRVIHTSQGDGGDAGGGRRGAEAPRDEPPAKGAGPDKGRPKGKGGPPGLVKPTMADTMKLNVYADNWFMLYVNGRLVAVDSIQFTPHNVVSVDFLPEYPMTIAVLAKDNADPKTGLEYGSSLGDGGFILKFGDGTVTNGTWKAKNFFHGPINGDTAHPKVIHEPLPANWWAVDFDDSTWKNAKEYTAEEVGPKQPFFEHDFEGAKFIWTDDLALDNTIIFRTKVDKPGWKPRWNTKPDLDVTGAPQR